MNCKFIQSVLIAAALLLSASSSLAAETKPGAAGEAISGPKATDKATKAKAAKAAKAASKIKLVDINSASKAELKTLPGVSDQYADKIIAGRPYLSKADLATRKIFPAGPYELIRNRVIARPNEATAAKLSGLQKKAR